MSTEPVFATKEAAIAAAVENIISGQVKVRLSHLVEDDAYGVAEQLSALLIGPLLGSKLIDVQYKIVGHSETELDLLVSADVKLLRAQP